MGATSGPTSPPFTLRALADGLVDPTVAAAASLAVGAPISVKTYGAKGDANSTGSTGTDDSTAILAAATAAAAAGRPLLFPAVANGYRCLTGIAVANGVDVIMESPIFHPGGGSALTVGAAGSAGSSRNPYRRLKLMVQRITQSDWSDWTGTDATDIGILLYNCYWCDLDLLSFGHTIPCRLQGDGASGFVYNRIFPRLLANGKVQLDLKSTGSGWVNQNIFLGGSIKRNTGVNASADCWGLRFAPSQSVYYDDNYMVNTSFELNKTTSIPIYFAGQARFNRILHVRNESNSAMVAQSDDAGSLYNHVGVAYQAAGQQSVSGVGLTLEAASNRDTWRESVWNSGPLIDRAYHTAAASSGLLGLAIVSSAAATLNRGMTAFPFDANGELSWLSAGSARGLGFVLKLNRGRRISIRLKGAARTTTDGCTLYIAPYASGSLRSNTAGDITTLEAGGTAVWSASYGGAWKIDEGTTQAGLFNFLVASAVDTINVMIVGKTTASRLHSFDIIIHDSGEPIAPYAGFVNSDLRISTAAPTTDLGFTYAVGVELLNGSYAGSGTTRWKNSSTTTFGTWTALTG